jgi:hypothetical protein
MRKVIKTDYQNQRNNKYRPGATCNLTSAAIALSVRGVKSNTPGLSLEDALFECAERNGYNIHTPDGIKSTVETYAPDILCSFTANGSIERIIAAINRDNVVVVHGYFTRSGHIVAVVGYDSDKKTLIVDDPWGDCIIENGKPVGYRLNNTTDDSENQPGNDSEFRFQTFASICSDSPESSWQDINDIWMHEVMKRP